MGCVPFPLEIMVASIVTLNLEIVETKSRIQYAFDGT